MAESRRFLFVPSFALPLLGYLVAISERAVELACVASSPRSESEEQV